MFSPIRPLSSRHLLSWMTGLALLGTGCFGFGPRERVPSKADASSGADTLPPDLPDVGEPDHDVPFSTTEDHLTVYRDGRHRPLFVKGINLGVGVPGTQAGQLAASRGQYRRWFDRMREIGFNAIRLYTIHDPRLYQELARHNHRHPDDPLYLLQGVWLPEDVPEDDLHRATDELDRRIETAVDVVHGNRTIEPRRGQAFGAYQTNVSRWTLAWIVGREIVPNEVETTNERHADQTSFEGNHVRVEAGDPVEVWLARRLEHLIAYERRRYDIDRPVSIASWPTLDPLDHPTEGSDYSSEDVADFDVAQIETVDAPGGLFASFHAYPYYPNFISEEPDYRAYADAEGPNAYLGYLHDLAEHFDDMPLLIAEFGVPTSWANAHSGGGMNHGGHTEIEQGRATDRMMRNMLEAETAGGAFFAWIDEWWKPTWLKNPRDFPAARRRFWPHVVAPEQNFGLLEFTLPAPDFEAGTTVEGEGRLRRARATTDAAYFHLRLEMRPSLESGDRLIVGFDTYRDDLGESVLPGGIETNRRHEFALVVEGRSSAEWHVTPAYNLIGIWHHEPEGAQRYRSVRSNDGTWELFRMQNGQPHGSNDGEFWFETTYDETGRLRIRTGEADASTLDAVVVSENAVEIRIPWTLLNVTDPSRRRVMHDDLETPERETTRTSGIAVSVALEGERLVESDRVGWSTWDDAPETTVREKRSVPIVRRTLDDLPRWLDSP